MIDLKTKKRLSALLAVTDKLAADITQAIRDRDTRAEQIVGVHAVIAAVEAQRPPEATTEAIADADAILANPKAAGSFLSRFRSKAKAEGPYADWTAKRAALKAAARRGEDRVAELEGLIIGLRDQQEQAMKAYQRAGALAYDDAFMEWAIAGDKAILQVWAAYGGLVSQRVRMWRWKEGRGTTGVSALPTIEPFITDSNFHDPDRAVALADFEAELRKLAA